MNALRRKRPHEVENVVLHQDNAPAHTSRIATSTLEFLNMETLKHPPYSPDLAPCNFFLFPSLKSELHGKRFDDEDELRMAVQSQLKQLAADGFQHVFDSWVHRHRKCIAHKGIYFEKE